MKNVHLANSDDWAAITQILTERNLPTQDLDFQAIEFWVVRDGNELAGVAGLEKHGNVGLLRSVAVREKHMGKGLGALLVQEILDFAQKSNLQSIFLLTETAENWFPRFGFERVGREEVPAILLTSSEFSHVCPVSAIILAKKLTKEGH